MIPIIDVPCVSERGRERAQLSAVANDALDGWVE